jgi:hypothetical protein
MSSRLQTISVTSSIHHRPSPQKPGRSSRPRNPLCQADPVCKTVMADAGRSARQGRGPGRAVGVQSSPPSPREGGIPSSRKAVAGAGTGRTPWAQRTLPKPCTPASHDPVRARRCRDSRPPQSAMASRPHLVEVDLLHPLSVGRLSHRDGVIDRAGPLPHRIGRSRHR